MNSSLFLLLGLGGKLDSKTLNDLVTRGNEKRRKTFMKLADLLFGLFMLLFGQIKLKDAAGKDIDLSNPSALSGEDKLNAILLGQDLTQRGLLFREFLRPAIVGIAELIAALMEPDEMLLNLIGSKQAGPSGDITGAYEGRVIKGPQDLRVFHIVNGQRRWILSPTTLQTVYGGRYETVAQDIVDAIPNGPNEA